MNIFYWLITYPHQVMTEKAYFNINFVELILINSTWMFWNIFLAAIPLVIAYKIFIYQPTLYKRSKFLFYPLFILFVLFLPNTIYVLTDAIHLIDQIRYSTFNYYLLIMVLIPLYLIFMFLGTFIYILAITWYWKWLRKYVFSIKKEIPVYTYIIFLTVVPLLMGYGIWLGRSEHLRFNSWQFFSHPLQILQAPLTLLANPQELYIIVIMSFCSFILNLATILWINQQK